MQQQQYYNDYFPMCQIYSYKDTLNLELDKNDPVFTVIEVLGEMNFDELLNQYSPKGRKAINPIALFGIIMYSNMLGIRSIDKMVERCKKDLGFIHIAQGIQPKRDAFYSFINDRLTVDIIEELHYQFVILMSKKGYVDLSKVYVDGTKIEANANRYTFVWRGSINYHLVELLRKISTTIDNYNDFITVNQYKQQYSLFCEQMFYIEGSEKVRQVVEKNKKRKLEGIDKLSNNHILKIGNIGPDTLSRMIIAISIIIESENIVVVNGKGKRKSEAQKLFEHLIELKTRLQTYANNFEIMGDDRNSYSKTDNDATFMRMKDDHMLNGQLKPAYNLQFAVENYFITDVLLSNDRTDYKTLRPLLEKRFRYIDDAVEQLTADSGYCSEENLAMLKRLAIKPFIKTQDHELKKRRKYAKEIGKHYNMDYVSETDLYICANGSELTLIREGFRTSTTGYKREFKLYSTDKCMSCCHRKECMPRSGSDRCKQLFVFHKDNQLKQETYANILSDEGIYNRKVRSIQTEGAFADMKGNNNFTRFNRREYEGIYKEIFMYVIGKNIMKYHRFKNDALKRYA